MKNRGAKKTIVLLMVMIVALANVFVVPATAANTDNTLKTPSGMTIYDFEQFLAEHMAEHIGSDVAGASVIVVGNGDMLLSRHFGYADIENELRITADTVIDSASVSKLITWVSVMQLAEQGRLDLNADIRSYLPDGFFRRLQFDAPITMMNLMHHNAGWGDSIIGFFASSPEGVVSLGDGLHRYEPLQLFEPGFTFAYSNYGVALAGYIVEHITGMPFYTYVNQYIFAPLGMKDTSIHPTQADNPSVAARRRETRGYTQAGGKITRFHPHPLYSWTYPTGGMTGTAEDLANFLIALMPAEGEASPLFRQEGTLEKMLTTSLSFADGAAGVAHGFFVELFGVRVLGHLGSGQSETARFSFAPEYGFGLIVLTNQDFVHDFNREIAVALFGEFVPPVYTGQLPDIRGLDVGMFRSSSRMYGGFIHILGALPGLIIEVVDERTITVMGEPFVQVSPLLFGSYEASNLLQLEVSGNYISRISMIAMGPGGISIASEFFPSTGQELMAVFLSIISFGIILLYLIISAFIMAIGAIRNRRKGAASPLAKKLNVVLNLFGLGVVVNYLLMFTGLRSFRLLAFRDFAPHFGFNIAYMAFVPVCSFLIFWNMRKSELSKGSKVFCILSCVAAVAFAVLMLVWEFYR